MNLVQMPDGTMQGTDISVFRGVDARQQRDRYARQRRAEGRHVESLKFNGFGEEAVYMAEVYPAGYDEATA